MTTSSDSDTNSSGDLDQTQAERIDSHPSMPGARKGEPTYPIDQHLVVRQDQEFVRPACRPLEGKGLAAETFQLRSSSFTLSSLPEALGW